MAVIVELALHQGNEIRQTWLASRLPGPSDSAILCPPNEGLNVTVPTMPSLFYRTYSSVGERFGAELQVPERDNLTLKSSNNSVYSYSLLKIWVG